MVKGVGFLGKEKASFFSRARRLNPNLTFLKWKKKPTNKAEKNRQRISIIKSGFPFTEVRIISYLKEAFFAMRCRITSERLGTWELCVFSYELFPSYEINSYSHSLTGASVLCHSLIAITISEK